MSAPGEAKASVVEVAKEWKYTIAASVAVAAGALIGYRVLSQRGGSDTGSAAGGASASPRGLASEASDEIVTEVDDSQAPQSKEEMKEKAKEFKKRGNDAYKSKRFEEAMQHYTQAIALNPGNTDTAVYFCNRAACQLFLKNHSEVVADCTEALKLDAGYIKAINRRAQAYENLGDYKAALLDYTAVCILQGFKAQPSMLAADRVLRHIGETLTDEHLRTAVPALPSDSSVEQQLRLYTDREEPEASSVKELLAQVVADSSNGALQYRLARAYLAARKYNEVLNCTIKAIELLSATHNEDDAPVPQLTAARILAATFLTLKNQCNEAIGYLDTVLAAEPESIEALLKKAWALLELKQQEPAMELTKKAVDINPQDADARFHRGQFHFMAGRLAEAVVDFKASQELDPNRYPSYLQLAVCLYKMGDAPGAVQLFKDTMEQFKDEGSVNLHYSQVLFDLKDFKQALEQVDLAIDKNPKMATTYVTKALLYLQMKSNGSEAEKLIRKAIKVDPKCELAYERLAQLQLQKGDMQLAVKNFNMVISLARSRDDLITAFACREAALAQNKAIQEQPHLKKAMLANAMASM